MKIKKYWVAGFLAAFSFGFVQKSEPTLKETFKNDFLIGAAINNSHFSGRDEKGVALIKQQFNTISPENVLKWESVHPELDQYNFKDSDRYVAFGEKNKMFIIGHVLVWHNQTPKLVFEDKKGKPESLKLYWSNSG